MNKNQLQLIKVLESYHPLSEKDQEAVLKLFSQRKVLKNNYFCMIDDIPKEIAFINKGIIKGVYLDAEGKEKIKGFRGENDFITSYRALLKNQKSDFALQALCDCELLIMKFSDFEVFLEESLLWNKVFRAVVDEAFVQKDIRESQLLNLDLKERYKRFMEENKKYHEKIPKNQIALYLNVRPQSLSRMLAKDKL